MLVEHPNFGQLLRRARKRKDSFGLGFGCRVYRVWGGGGGAVDTTREESRSWLFRMLDMLASSEKLAVAVFWQGSCRHRIRI